MGYREGIQYPYTGSRTEEGIVNWVQERQGPFVRESQCSDIEGADENRAKNSPIIRMDSFIFSIIMFKLRNQYSPPFSKS